MSNKHPLKHEMKVCIEEMNVHINEVVSQIGGPPFLSAPTCGCISRPYLAPRSNQPPLFRSQPPRPSSCTRNARYRSAAPPVKLNFLRPRAHLLPFRHLEGEISWSWMSIRSHVSRVSRGFFATRWCTCIMTEEHKYSRR